MSDEFLWCLFGASCGALIAVILVQVIFTSYIKKIYWRGRKEGFEEAVGKILGIGELDELDGTQCDDTEN